MKPTRRRRIAAALAPLALLTACTLPGATMNRAAELAARPTLEDAVARYETLLSEIRDRLDTEVGPLDWATSRPPGGAGCGKDFPNMGGNTATTPLWLGPGNISDQRWPRATQIVIELSRNYGFDITNTVVDRPGNHEISTYDPYGAYLIFGTAGNTILRIGTGCHLTAAKKAEATAGG